MRVTTYIYPDGTKSIRKPRDGETYQAWDPSINDARVWQWDGYKNQWFDITKKQAPGSVTITLPPAPVMTGKNLKITLNGVELKFEGDCSYNIDAEYKCECGSESVGSSKHSTWCKKWNPND